MINLLLNRKRIRRLFRAIDKIMPENLSNTNHLNDDYVSSLKDMISSQDVLEESLVKRVVSRGGDNGNSLFLSRRLDKMLDKYEKMDSKSIIDAVGTGFINDIKLREVLTYGAHQLNILQNLIDTGDVVIDLEVQSHIHRVKKIGKVLKDKKLLEKSE